MTLGRTKKIVVAMGATAALALTPVAEAHTFNGTTSTGIRYASGAFRGKIASNRPLCKRSRTVRLYKARRGPDRLLRSTTSWRSGAWKISRARRRGRYYVRVVGRTSGGYSHSHRCAAASSSILRLGR